jgi:uncharacterized protein with FMN-binding domain
MRRVLLALVLTAVAIVALARYETHLPRTVNPASALKPASTPRAIQPAGVRVATSPAITTPFSVIQVQATLTHGKLTGVKTVSLTGDGPHTEALNAHAEPILREEALRAGGAKVDVVSGATYTSEAWIASLRAAIRLARSGGAAA